MARWMDWVLPPALQGALRRLRALGRSPIWQVAPEGFAGPAASRGWNVQAIVDLQRANWPVWRASVAAPHLLGLNFEAAVPKHLELAQHNTLLAFAYVAARAAQGRESLSLLDWGGGLGHYALLTRGLFPDLRLEYICHDLPLFCEAGRALLPEDRFFDDAEAALQGRYDLVLASSSLWYERDWKERLAQLAEASKGWVYVTRQIVVEGAPSFVALQRPAAFGYPTEYLCWILNRQELLDHARSLGLAFEREFMIHPGPAIQGAPVHGDYRGYLFRRA
jgi:putative methyltransferase (TIGR04325 family)